MTVLCELPNYPSGNFTAGYPKFWYHTELSTNDRLQIIRVPVWANSRTTTIQRLGFFTSFMLSASLRAIFLPRHDLVIASSPPLFVGLIATFLRPFKRAKYVLDLRDIWPESARVLGEINSKSMLRFGRFLERMVYRSVDAFFLAVPGFKEYLDNQHQTHRSKPKKNLMNGVSEDYIKLIQQYSATPKSKTFRILFSGNVGLAQGLETVLDAAHLLNEANVEFRIIGEGAKLEALVQYSKSLQLANVSFIPSIPREELVGEILSAHVCLVPLIKSALFLNAIPSKTLEYMAAGRPVIVGIKGEIEKLLDDAQAGVSIEPQNAQELAATILAYRNDPKRLSQEGIAGQEFIQSQMTKEVLMDAALNNLFDESV